MKYVELDRPFDKTVLVCKECVLGHCNEFNINDKKLDEWDQTDVEWTKIPRHKHKVRLQT